MQDFRKLRVWARAHVLGLDVYRETLKWPRGHGAIANQTRRAAMSIAANITEGCGQEHSAEFARYLHMALASSSELDHHLQAAVELRLIETVTHVTLLREVHAVRGMLVLLRRRVLGAPS